jgi:hypothetical protein
MRQRLRILEFRHGSPPVFSGALVVVFDARVRRVWTAMSWPA